MNPKQFNNIITPKEDKYGLHNNLLSKMSSPRFSTPEYFHKEVTPETKITNQKSSGRCWLFAGLNLLRRHTIHELSLESTFEFSQSYLFFWDKMERMNYWTNIVEEKKNNGVKFDDRALNFIMNDPFGDGGQWSMFKNLVDKYGLVSKNAYPESHHSSNSVGVNLVLTKMFRNYVTKMYNEKPVNKEELLNKTYSILVKFFGKPPTKFNFEYKIDKTNSKNDKIIHSLLITPKNFVEFCDIDMSKYVSIINDPRNEYNKLYTVDILNNMEKGEVVEYLNIDINRFSELTKESIIQNKPVWFGSDVGQFHHRTSAMLDETIFNFDDYLDLNLTMTKEDRINSCDSIPSHAMVYVGYHNDINNEIDYWKIENSWGTSGAYNGYLVCSNKWFKEYTFQIIVEKCLLSSDEKTVFETKKFNKVLPLWDPIGTLA